jgi:hypothetical protein
VWIEEGVFDKEVFWVEVTGKGKGKAVAVRATKQYGVVEV